MLRFFYLYIFIISLPMVGCSAHMGKHTDPLNQCIDQLERRMKDAPTQSHLFTLDGQKVPLGEFFEQCLKKMPLCTLPDKFYHWNNEIKSVTSNTPDGEVTHNIRIYFNYLSACDPEKIHPDKTHGDIAEFYDAEGKFMGLAVYVGEGLYCPLPYSNYSGGKQLRFYM